MTYKENIERLRSAGRYNLALQKQNVRARKTFINNKEKEILEDIDKGTDLLVGDKFGSDRIVSGEGGAIPFLYGERIKKKEKEGIEAEKKDRARKVAELEAKLQEASDTDTAQLKAKYKMLINGYKYEEADAYAKLSPHAQVAYARRKLGLWKKSVALQLNGQLAEDFTKYHIKNFNKDLSSKDIHNDPNVPPIVKEAFVNNALDKLIKDNGIDGFSDELLELEQINDYVDRETGEIKSGAHSLAKEEIMKKYRTIYNVTASNRDAVLHMENFLVDKDLTKLLAGLSSGVIEDGITPAGHLGAWDKAEKLIVNALMNGDIESIEALAQIFKDSPSPGKDNLMDSHEHRYNNIVIEFGRQAAARVRAEAQIAATKGNQFIYKTQQDFAKGGKLYNYLFNTIKIQDKTQEEREEAVLAMLMSLQTQYAAIDGTQSVSENGLSPFLSDLYNQLIFTDQEELVQKALTKLDNGDPILPSDTKLLSMDSLRRLAAHPNWEGNQGFIKARGLTHRWVTPNGEPGRDLTIQNLIKDALKANAIEDKNNTLVSHLEPKLLNRFDTAFKDALKGTINGKPVTADQAFDQAMGHIKWYLGLDDDDYIPGDSKKGGEFRKADLVRDFLKMDTGYSSKTIYMEKFNQKKGEELASILKTKTSSLDEGKLLVGTRYYIPSLGPDSKEFKQLLAFVESGEGQIPYIYHQIAHYMPNHTAEQLINWQLAQVGKALPTKSLANEAILFNEELNGFHRLIGFKTNSSDLHQAKINAIDGLRLSGIVTEKLTGQLPENQNLTFTQPDKKYIKSGGKEGNPGGLPIRPDEGDGDDGEVEISKDQQLINEEKRLSDIYTEKGYHEIHPGPRPEPEDFPIQPGDRIDMNFFTPDLRKFNMDAYWKAVEEWTGKNNTYRPLTKEQTQGGRSGKWKSTVYFNPETDSYEKIDLESRLFPEEKRDGRAELSKQRQEHSRNLRLERAESMPNSKVVNVHRQDGKYIHGPITVYKHVDQNGYVQYKLAPSGPNSNLQSFWNIPGSPVLSPLFQNYATELYTQHLHTA